MSQSLGGSIELAVSKVETSHHGTNGAGAALDGHQRPLDLGNPVQLHFDGPLLTVDALQGEGADVTRFEDLVQTLLSGPVHVVGPDRGPVAADLHLCRTLVRLKNEAVNHLAGGENGVPIGTPVPVQLFPGLENVLFGAAPSSPLLVERLQSVTKRRFGRRLKFVVQSRVNLQASPVDLPAGEPFLQILAHPFHEVGGRRLLPGPGLQAQGRLHIGSQPLRVDEALIVSSLQNPVSSLHGQVRVMQGGIPGGRPNQAGQQGRFVPLQLVQGFLEVELGSGRQSVSSVPHVHLVDVAGEDLILGQGALDLDGEDHVLNLALDRHLGTGQQQFAQLHGDGGGAFSFSIDDVPEDGVDEAAEVDAGVPEEARVFGRQDRVLHRVRNLVVGDDLPLLHRENAQHPPVRRIDLGDDVRPGLLQLIDLSQFDSPGQNQAGEGPGHGRRDDQDGARRPDQKAAPAGGRLLAGGGFVSTRHHCILHDSLCQ